jgi:hypothetical protein
VQRGQQRGAGRRPRHWEVELYERQDGSQPAETFFGQIGDDVAQRLIGYVDRVAEDPVGYPAGPEWQAMHGAALGCHEVRVRFGQTLYRLFVKLDSAPFEGSPGLARFVLLSGASKAVGTALPEKVYRDVGVMAADYALHRKVSPPE